MAKKIHSFIIFFMILLLPLLFLYLTINLQKDMQTKPYQYININENNFGFSISLQGESIRAKIINDIVNEVPNIPNSSDLILEYDPIRKKDIFNFIQKIGGNIKRIYSYSSQISIYIPIANLTYLKDISGIRNIWKDRIFQAFLDTSVPIIKPPVQWTAIETFFGQQVNGTGIRVAVLDTGIYGSHWDLTPRVILNCSYVSGEDWQDWHGHGTHVAGIIAGSGNRSSGLYTGVAPAVELMNFKVLNQFAQGSESDVIAAIEDAVGNSSDIINLSLGTTESGNGSDPYSQKVQWAVSMGVICVIASGGNTGFYNISQPGVCSAGITIGAATDDDLLYSIQPAGPTLDFRLKPDILAPGKDIISVRVAGLGFGYIIDPYYTRVSGTSMAAAHVSGIVALIKQVHPTWTPQQVKDVLMNNAKNLGFDVYQQGAGRIQAPESINSTIICNGNLDFGFVGRASTKILNLSITNLENNQKNLTLIHQNLNYNLISSIILPPLTNIQLSINLTPNELSNYHNFDLLNISWGGSNIIHSVLTNICPNLTMMMPLDLKCGDTANISGQIIVDDIIALNYSSYFGNLYVNSTSGLPFVINNSGHYYVNYSNFIRAIYNITIGIFDSQNNLVDFSTKIQYIGGLAAPFIIICIPTIYGNWGGGIIQFSDPTVFGTVQIEILYPDVRKVSISNIINGRGVFLIPPTILPQNIKNPLKGTYEGSSIHETSTSYSEIIYISNFWKDNSNYLLIGTVILIGIICSFIVYKYLIRNRPTYEQKLKSIEKPETPKIIEQIQIQKKELPNLELKGTFDEQYASLRLLFEEGEKLKKSNGPYKKFFERILSYRIKFSDFSLKEKVKIYELLYGACRKIGDLRSRDFSHKIALIYRELRDFRNKKLWDNRAQKS